METKFLHINQHLYYDGSVSIIVVVGGGNPHHHEIDSECCWNRYAWPMSILQDPTVGVKCTRKSTQIITSEASKVTVEFSCELSIFFLLVLFSLYSNSDSS